MLEQVLLRAAALLVLVGLSGLADGGRSEYRSCAVSESGRWTAASLVDGGVELRDAELCRSLLLEPTSATYFRTLCFSSDETMLVGADHGGALVRWDLECKWGLPGKWIRAGKALEVKQKRGAERGPREPSWYLVPTISISPDSTRIFAAWEDGRRELYSRSGSLVSEFRDEPTRPEADEQGWRSLGGWFDARDVVWLPNTGDMLLRLGNTVRVFDASTGQPRLHEEKPIEIVVNGVVHACAVDADVRRIALGYGNMYIALFDFETRERLREYRYTDPFILDKEAFVHQLAFSPSGDRLAFTSSGGAYVGVLDADTLAELYDSDFRGGHFGEVLRLTWIGQGDALAYWFDCGANGLEVLDLRTEPRRLGLAQHGLPGFRSQGVVVISYQDGSLVHLSTDELYERGTFIPEVRGIEEDE